MHLNLTNTTIRFTIDIMNNLTYHQIITSSIYIVAPSTALHPTVASPSLSQTPPERSPPAPTLTSVTRTPVNISNVSTVLRGMVVELAKMNCGLWHRGSNRCKVQVYSIIENTYSIMPFLLRNLGFITSLNFFTCSTFFRAPHSAYFSIAMSSFS